MANSLNTASRTSPWRTIGWGGALVLLAAPFVAMQFSPAMNWGPGDFGLVALILAAAGGLAELAVRMSPRWDYRAGFALAILGTALVVVVNLAVGIVGSEANPANLWFFGVLLIAFIGAAAARLKAAGMALAMFATAVGLIITLAFANNAFPPASLETLATMMFALIFVVSGLLFRRAASRPR